MSIRQVSRKLRAWETGKPIPRYSTIHHAIVPASQALAVAFIRMAGESRPWGIAWGTVDSTPSIVTVPDGRVRDDVAVLCARFAEDLLTHLRVHNWTYDPIGKDADVSELRQVWLPNGKHVDMLHHLSYTYSQTKFGGVNQDLLGAFGRLAGWLFRESSRQGDQHLVNASQALSDAFTFPAQDSRTAHLGFQLAWLTTTGDRDIRVLAANEAEGLTVSPTLDPVLERDELSGPVEKWNVLRRQGVDSLALASDISAILEPELERRWNLTASAYHLLSVDRPVNPGVNALVENAHREFWGQHQRIELRIADPSLGPAFIAHPETDFHGSAAASRYLVHVAADEVFTGLLIHDDPELLSEAIDDGYAVRGVVTAVTNLGSGRTVIPVWQFRLAPGLIHRMREGSRLVPYGSPGHEAVVDSVDVGPQGTDFQVRWNGRKTMVLSCGISQKPLDVAWVGEEVIFFLSDAASLTKRRSQRVWQAKNGPGAWLTHGKSSAPITIETDDGSTDLLVDDIIQIEGGDAI